ncbi:CubicO group peptidase (beta-lactamase class C family) [Kribbella pratensis]|uniref:CubicO group peptidase (Beta-lactamase class C family) n=1 Tax=Kribbella pratensis TaxID=2512112 RepID=A0ABY2FHE5_9ACTN|nr:serine hydrolase domain-containing protein [Kribbella pratensis]TDW90801.1 CubicO group peptidase (beta-lactamase class C family) [Kribbella pratensis]
MSSGWVDEGFGAVADAFAENFSLFPELGAAVSVYAGGRQVVELWDGDAAPGRPWKRETVVPVFSCAKGLVSVVVHLLAQEGRLDLDAPIGAYWPEFVAAGKDAITCRMMLGHRAGIPVLDKTLTFDEIAAWTPVIAAVEEQKPLWEPGTAYEYHGHVFGFVLGEVVRRITGQLPGAYFRTVIGDPLGLRAWIGLAAAEVSTVARLEEAEGRPPGLDPEHLLMRIVTMNGALEFPGLDVPHGWNDPDLHAMELPGAGAVASASGLAGVYAAAVTGIDDSPRLLTPDTVGDAVREVSSGAGFLGFDAGARWGSGFLLDSPFRPTLGPRSFGNDGAGGQFAFGDDEYGVAFAYTANRMLGHGDPRAAHLITALRTCLP